LLVISGRGERAAAHGNREFLATTVEAARVHGVAHELLDDAHIRRRFPAFNIADGDEAYFEPEAGILFPERCIAAQLQQAREHGAVLHLNETVNSFVSDKSGVHAVTSNGEYTASKLVIAAGPWLPELVPALSRLFTIRRQVLAWFRVDKSARTDIFRPGRLPVFYWQIPRAQAIYGFPCIDGETMKIATEQYETATTADTVARKVSAQEIADMHRGYVAPFFPAVTSDCVRAEVCLYTCADQARFVVDTLPGDRRVIVASPCSGHGFKHSAAIGEAVADLARFGQAQSLDLRQFRMPS
jgi:sarcosine oxidase